MSEFAPIITLSRAMAEPKLLGNIFAASSFWTWRVVAKLIDGLPLAEPREIALSEQCTGRAYNREARRAVRRIIILAGRRAGKDRFLSAVAVWRAALCADWRRYQSAGEGSVVILLGRDKKQAAILRKYCHGLLRVPSLAAEVVRETNDVIEFRNGASLEIASNDVGLVRGRSAIAVLGSEAAQWKHDEHSASSDEEVVAAAEPSMAMCPDGGMLILGSSVYRKRGYMYRQFKELHGNAEATDICWFAPSRTMNPSLPQHVVDAALVKDPQRFGAEYNNIWREDLSDCFPLDAIEACTDDVWERAPMPGISYLAYVDMATGSGQDSAALCIVHRGTGAVPTVVLDVLRERKPRFVAYNVVAEWAQLLRQYGVAEVYGDSFAHGLVADEFARNHVMFRLSDTTTSENYLQALPMVLARRVVLLNNPVARNQLLSLERHVVGGREIVRHPQVASAHDDVAAVICGAIVTAGSRYGHDLNYRVFDPNFRDQDRPQPAVADWVSPNSRVHSANENLHNLYGALDLAFRTGFRRR